MTRGALDHSAIWSRTKMWRRNDSSVVWAFEISSGRVAVVMGAPGWGTSGDVDSITSAGSGHLAVEVVPGLPHEGVVPARVVGVDVDQCQPPHSSDGRVLPGDRRRAVRGRVFRIFRVDRSAIGRVVDEQLGGAGQLDDLGRRG